MSLFRSLGDLASSTLQGWEIVLRWGRGFLLFQDFNFSSGAREVIPRSFSERSEEGDLLSGQSRVCWKLERRALVRSGDGVIMNKHLSRTSTKLFVTVPWWERDLTERDRGRCPSSLVGWVDPTGTVSRKLGKGFRSDGFLWDGIPTVVGWWGWMKGNR